MSRRAELVRGLLHLIVLAAMGVVLFAPNAQAASRSEPLVLVLPFQFHSEQERGTLEDQFPEMLGRRIGAKGLNVVPHERMLNLVRSRKISTLDVAAVRSLAQAVGASYAVYGSVNQAGNALSIDARLVSAAASVQPKPLFVEQGLGTANLGYAMDELAGSVANEMPRPATAAASVPGNAGNVIAGVEVKGTKVLDPDVVLMRLTTRRGDKPDAAEIDQEVKRIWELGYFSDVQVSLEQRHDGLYVVYTVTEKPRLDSITIEGNDELDDDDIYSVMSSKSGSILNESLLAEDIQKILEAYRKKGFYLATVEQSLDSRGATATLTIRINEGKQLYIEAVRVEGVSQLDEGDVKDQLLLSERTIISWITGTGVLKEELIERDSAAITSYYLDHGFMDISVGAVKVDYSDSGITVTFPIQEGARYTLGDVSFSGDLIDTEERMRKEISTDKLAAKKEYFNLSVMQSDVKNLTDFYADYGYAFANIDAQPAKRGDGSQTVDINFNIAKKNKVYVRRVLVEGNDKTRDNVILREMRLTDGEQFEGNRLRRSTERLNKLGFFEVAEAELVPTDQEDEVDLKVKVKEKPTGALMAGVGYSTFSQVGVAGTIMERNLWGKGYLLSLQASFSGLRDAYTLSFTNPRFYDTPLSIGADLYHWRDDYIDYVKRTSGGVMRFGYPIGEYTSVGWGYRLEQYKIYDLNENAAEIIRQYSGKDRITSAVLGRITRDSTDRERPTSGNIDMISAEYGGGFMGGDDDYINLTAEHQSYYQLWPDHVLHGRIKGSMLFENGSKDIPVFERFWMGGMNSVRGYDSRDIVPRDRKTGDRIGGTRMAFMNLEYIYTLNNEFGLYVVPFYDMGFNIDDDHDYTWDDEILKSAGLELRWRSPMGDLRFSYGIPFDEDRRGHKSSGRFEFSMGQIF